MNFQRNLAAIVLLVAMYSGRDVAHRVKFRLANLVTSASSNMPTFRAPTAVQAEKHRLTIRVYDDARPGVADMDVRTTNSPSNAVMARSYSIEWYRQKAR
jgi:hypothetical protein